MIDRITIALLTLPLCCSLLANTSFRVHGNLIFGHLPVGTSEQRTIKLCSEQAFVINAFSLDSQAFSDNYSATLESLSPADSADNQGFCQSILITFTPDTDQQDDFRLYGADTLKVDTSIGAAEVKVKGTGVGLQAWHDIAQTGWRYAGSALENSGSSASLLANDRNYTVMYNYNKRQVELFQIEENGVLFLTDTKSVPDSYFPYYSAQTEGEQNKKVVLMKGDELMWLARQGDELVTQGVWAVPPEARDQISRTGSYPNDIHLAVSPSAQCLLTNGVSFSAGDSQTLAIAEVYSDTAGKGTDGIIIADNQVILSYRYSNILSLGELAIDLYDFLGNGASLELCRLDETSCRVSHCNPLIVAGQINGFSVSRKTRELALLVCYLFSCELQIRSLDQPNEVVFSYSDRQMDFARVSDILYLPEAGGIMMYRSLSNFVTWNQMKTIKGQNYLVSSNFQAGQPWQADLSYLIAKDVTASADGRFIYVPTLSGKVGLLERLLVSDPVFGKLPTGIRKLGEDTVDKS